MSQPFLSESESSNRVKLAWLVRMRWAAMLALLGGVALGWWLGFVRTEFMGHAFITALALAVWNFLTGRWLSKQRPVSSACLTLQLSVDALALTLTLAWSGGSSNPLIPLVLLHASLGAILLRSTSAIVFAAVMLLCIGFLSFQTVFPLAPSSVHSASMTLFIAYLVVAAVMWILVAWLSLTLRSQARELAVLREKSARMNHLRSIGALSAGFAHEFATPLNTMKMRLDRIMRKGDASLAPETEAARQALQTCERSLRQFMDSRLDPEKIQLKTLCLKETAERLVASYGREHTGARLEFRSLTDKPCPVEVPLLAFSQSLLGLLDNAAAHSPEGETILVSVGKDRSSCFCIIEDDGPGFPEAILEHLGKPYVTSRETGNGLGLFNAITLMEALGGSLTVENQQGRGARVLLRLPESPPFSP